MSKDEARGNRARENGGGPGKTVASRKLEANRRNARHSTGPKTPEGKKAVSLNALKHGLCSKEVVILSGRGREDPDEYEALLARMIEDCKPVGFREEMLVEELAICYWRLRRACRVETAEVTAQLDEVESPDRPDDWSIAFAERCDPDGASGLLKKNVAGVKELEKILGYAIDEITRMGLLCERTCQLIERYFGTGPCTPALLCNAAFLNKVSEEIKALPAMAEFLGMKSDERTAVVLPLLQDELKALKRLEKEVEAKETRQLDLRRASLNLPVEGSADKILRYETSIKRHLYRAMDQLERLQRRRQGEHVPAPINIDVSTEK